MRASHSYKVVFDQATANASLFVDGAKVATASATTRTNPTYDVIHANQYLKIHGEITPLLSASSIRVKNLTMWRVPDPAASYEGKIFSIFSVASCFKR